MLNIVLLYSGDHKPQPQRRVECFSALVQEWRDLHAAREQGQVTFDLPQRNRPLHDEQKAADYKKSDHEKKVD